MCCGKKRMELKGTGQKLSIPKRAGPIRTELGNSAARDATRSSPPVAQNRRLMQVPLSQRGEQAQAATSAENAATTPTLIRVRYLATAPVRVRGLASGVCYEFSGASPVQDVDARDSGPLLHTRFFRQG